MTKYVLMVGSRGTDIPRYVFLNILYMLNPREVKPQVYTFPGIQMTIYHRFRKPYLLKIKYGTKEDSRLPVSDAQSSDSDNCLE